MFPEKKNPAYFKAKHRMELSGIQRKPLEPRGGQSDWAEMRLETEADDLYRDLSSRLDPECFLNKK